MATSPQTPPRIGIVGAGHIGATAAALFARAGHDVALSNARGPASLADAVARLNADAGAPRVRAETVEGAAAFGDVVLLALPWGALEMLPTAAVTAVAGKVVIDALNPIAPGYVILDLGGRASSDVVAERLPGARLVKAFNTMNWEQLGREGRPDAPRAERRALFVAGDDADAKSVVMALIDEIGFAAVDTGALRDGGRLQEPKQPLSDRPLTGAEGEALVQALVQALVGGNAPPAHV